MQSIVGAAGSEEVHQPRPTPGFATEQGQLAVSIGRRPGHPGRPAGAHGSVRWSCSAWTLKAQHSACTRSTALRSARVELAKEPATHALLSILGASWGGSERTKGRVRSTSTYCSALYANGARAVCTARARAPDGGVQKHAWRGFLQLWRPSAAPRMRPAAAARQVKSKPPARFGHVPHTPPTPPSRVPRSGDGFFKLRCHEPPY